MLKSHPMLYTSLLQEQKMLKDITLGQYYPSDSIIHKIDPRIKILSLIFIIIAVFISKTPIAFGIGILFNFVLIIISKIRFKTIVNAVKPVLFLVLFTAVINIFLTKGEAVFSYKFIVITKEGIYSAVSMAIRIILLVSYTSLLTFTTSPIRLTDGIESLLKPFSKIGLPAHELAMMMTIALRFIPTLLEETDKIIMAQKSRGADFESGNILRRAKALIPILVPLFINSFRRADELATAMECRCYRGGENRTKLKELKIRYFDIIGFMISLSFFGFIILVGVFKI